MSWTKSKQGMWIESLEPLYHLSFLDHGLRQTEYTVLPSSKRLPPWLFYISREFDNILVILIDKYSNVPNTSDTLKSYNVYTQSHHWSMTIYLLFIYYLLVSFTECTINIYKILLLLSLTYCRTARRIIYSTLIQAWLKLTIFRPLHLEKTYINLTTIIINRIINVLLSQILLLFSHNQNRSTWKM